MNNLLQHLSTILGSMSLIDWIVRALLPGLLVIITFFTLFWRYIKIQWRFGNNLRRKIYFLKTSEDKPLQSEKESLCKLKMFRVIEEVKDISGSIKILQALDKNAVYIVGYSKQYDKYEKLIRLAEDANIPVIFFAKFGEITSEHRGLFDESMFCDVANTSRRLIIILLNTLKIV
ncbi:MAG: hypothetical protein SD837_00965 [Candidatus Electrothrix scaldis]|nr:MAG: hypothetical protein SD837_00965 [Candidatus Electrothrix sp. GW3-3]